MKSLYIYLSGLDFLSSTDAVKNIALINSQIFDDNPNDCAVSFGLPLDKNGLYMTCKSLNQYWHIRVLASVEMSEEDDELLDEINSLLSLMIEEADRNFQLTESISMRFTKQGLKDPIWQLIKRLYAGISDNLVESAGKLESFSDTLFQNFLDEE